MILFVIKEIVVLIGKIYEIDIEFDIFYRYKVYVVKLRQLKIYLKLVCCIILLVLYDNNFYMICQVYQYNVYVEGFVFYFFKKVLMEMGLEYKDMEFVFFMFIFKGYMGEYVIIKYYILDLNIEDDYQWVYIWN